MTDDVAKAICNMAGRSVYDAVNRQPISVCSCCTRMEDGTLRCELWTSFRSEARAAIEAAYLWNKRERRWPEFVGKK